MLLENHILYFSACINYEKMYPVNFFSEVFRFSLRILVAGERCNMLQENILKEVPHLNK